MKGFMIFVEGSNAPTVVHSPFTVAKTEAHRLANKFPDKEILVLQIAKRFMLVDGAVKSLGSHLPVDYKLTPKSMVPHDSPDRFIPTPTPKKEPKAPQHKQAPTASAKKPFVVVKKKPAWERPDEILREELRKHGLTQVE